MDKRKAMTILGIKDLKDLKSVYRKKCLSEHPDKNPNDPNASERFRLIKEAYEYLVDEKVKEACISLIKGYKVPNSNIILQYEDVEPLLKNLQLFKKYYGDNAAEMQRKFEHLFVHMRNKGDW